MKIIPGTLVRFKPDEPINASYETRQKFKGKVGEITHIKNTSGQMLVSVWFPELEITDEQRYLYRYNVLFVPGSNKK